ncbi:MAG: DUF805 domain-containing protein [SAR324 cluster bacterium]|nr:DUF805 domain-containing protein [SAR324 cluster bacterium]
MNKYINSYINSWRNYFSFQGRASRTEYWTFNLINAFIMLFIIFMLTPGDGANAVIDNTFEDNSTYLNESILNYSDNNFYRGFFIISLIPSITLTIRRLHDSNKSGWLVLIYFMPFIGWLIVLAMMLLPSTYLNNRYGTLPD